MLATEDKQLFNCRCKAYTADVNDACSDHNFFIVVMNLVSLQSIT